ncbi:MAG: hypothetical protein KME16_28120 [Scytolyngbya sp. HA4215-MV1]|jgi:hypothetical protein|nr:hypothetical protein [Scytolyngbya sp. HA4215-MV1]
MTVETLIAEALITAIGLGLLVKRQKISAVQPQPVAISIPVNHLEKH